MLNRIAALPLWAKLTLGVIALLEVALGVIALLAGVALGPFAKVIAELVFGVSVVALIFRALRGRPIGGWAKVSVVSLVALFVFTQITNALFPPRGGGNATETPPSASKAPASAPPPASKPQTIPVQIRVSGTPGTPYSCKNSSFAFEEGKSDPVRYEEDVSGTLGTEPVLYDSQAVNTYPHNLDFVGASCRIIGGPSHTGSLKAEILADGEVKAEEETRPDPPGKKSMESEHVQPRWAPKCPNWDVDWDCG